MKQQEEVGKEGEKRKEEARIRRQSIKDKCKNRNNRHMGNGGDGWTDENEENCRSVLRKK